MSSGKQMKIVLTEFAKKRHFPGDEPKSGTIIPDISSEEFVKQINHIHETTEDQKLIDGYAPFCKLYPVENFTLARSGAIEITPENEQYLKTGYKARVDGELPVLARWFEGIKPPVAKYLMIVLYSAEQLAKEGSPIDGDYGIVAILGQETPEETPMPPITMMRNALGIKEGGSGHPLDRKAYEKSVRFWLKHATVQI